MVKPRPIRRRIPDATARNAIGLATVAHAIAIDGDAATVRNCKVYDFRGDAIWVRNTTYEFSRMIRMPRVINNKISHCWNGIVAAAVDTQVEGESNCERPR
jgi:hypothetical protein